MAAVLADPLAPELLADVKIEPLPSRPTDVIAQATRAAWAALPPATDEEAKATPPIALLLSEAERETIQAHAAAFRTAKEAQVEAEAALALAERQARGLEAAKRRAGEAAASAFIGGTDEAAERDCIKRTLEQAEEAAAALPTLRQRALDASVALNRAYGGLRVSTRKALEQARHRQAQRYAELATELRAVVAHLSSTLELLGGDMTGWHTHFMPDLNLPALPMGVRTSHKGVEAHNYRDTLLRHGHGCLTAQTTAASGWLLRQIADASGLPASKVL
jgi:hypothetical protein